MPSPLTSSFASAAAGNTQDNPSSRRDGSGGGEWSRTRTNGATQTFRRPSLATNLSHTRESSQPSTTSSTTTGAYIPPHLNSNYQGPYRNGTANEYRYSKEQLLSIYKNQRQAGTLTKNLPDLFSGPWNPTESKNGVAATWGKREDGKEQSVGPDVCWEHSGKVEPLGLSEMTDDERELFSMSVNSPLKPPAGNSKDGTPGGGHRKTSISQNGPYNNSPHSGRPGPRRRETGDSISGANPLSPSGSTRFFRDEPNTSTPPAALLRRKTDIKDPTPEEKSTSQAKEDSNREADISSPFDNLKRRATGGPLSAGLNGPESPWSAGPHSATFGGMGAFGNFSLASGTAPTESTEKEKRPGFGSMRGESRFKGLLSNTSSEDMRSSTPEKPSSRNLEKLPEDDGGEASQAWDGSRQPRQNRSATNPYEEEMMMQGGRPGFDTDPRSQVQGDIGFSAFGDHIRNLVAAHHPGHDQTPQSRTQIQDPSSPTVTNPYQSPGGDHTKVEDDSQDLVDARRLNYPGLGSLREDSSADAFGSMRGKNAFDDRSQTSSTGPNRAFSAFGGLAGLPNIGNASPWSGNPMVSTGTPTKDRAGFPSAFGDSMFGSMADLQSPGLGGSSLFGSNPGTFGRSSKMGSLFPQAMQEQMREDRSRPESAGDGLGFRKEGEQRSGIHPGFFGEAGGAAQGSDGSSMHEANYPFGQSSEYGHGSSAPGSGAMSKVGPAEHQQGQIQSHENSSQLPAVQQRQMVMPDRMRWIYRDPQGNIQGPWSGLEMHDWFKAGFFTAELQVKRLEDHDYEPLAQLVRRIGNSREPFLVPQIGVPHGPPPPPGNPWAGGTSVSGGVPQGSGAQPPFASSFPSFGTTLTAEQQNALERRKQEEQYLMARQKEHLAQQQVLMKQIGMQGGPVPLHHNLQHHSSAHSLHSQPSFGSLTSPPAYQQSPTQGPIQPPSMAGFPDPARPPRQVPIGGSQARNDMDELSPFFERMNVNRGQPPFSGGPFGGSGSEGPSQQAIGSMLQDRSRLQAEQQQLLSLGGEPLPNFLNNDRLQEFHDLRSLSDVTAIPGQGPSSIPIGGSRPRADEDAKRAAMQGTSNTMEAKEESPEPEMLSLSKQAQDVAASQHQSPSAWQNKIEITQTIVPPPQSASPLPAPAAKRHHNVADTLVAESRSQTQTPVDTPSASIAPWADKIAEIAKGPSLKEIQEAEAKKAAKQEEIAAAARRAQAELELKQVTAMAQPPPPGLPSSSTWANTTTPASPVSTGSVWTKSGINKATPTPAATTKKTLAQIQKEEELRKQKAATAAAAQHATSSANANAVAGKRYAELAGKISTAVPTAVPAAPNSSAWTTVGQGGKVKAPATVVAAPGLPARTASGSVPVQAKTRPVAPRAPSAVTSQSTAQTKATEELVKWAKGQLSKGLASGINVDDFVQSLLILPNETEIISDSVYATSQTLDGRRFAEEFVRKRKLADKGVVESGSSNGAGSSTANGSNGGWSEVAKKGPEKKEDSPSNAAFKVVASKKKGRR